MAAPEALVAWEAQFGDFVNGAQVAIDQFIVSGLSKWGQTSRLTLLLPHGYEGNGPEHSSARLERFLQLAAQENIRIANCTTAAQYFHLLRRQALDPSARPLVVMTPKGLLRLKQAASTLRRPRRGLVPAGARRPGADACRGAAARALLREALLRPRRTRAARAGAGRRGRADRAALPVPGRRRTAELVRSYPQLEEVVWAQEEPQNMGAWRAIRHRLEESLPDGRAAALRRPALAREPVRGLPDRAPEGAGPDRAGGVDALASVAVAAALLLRNHLGREDRPVLARLADERAAVLLRDPPPDVPGGQRQADGARATECAEACHGGRLALRPW